MVYIWLTPSIYISVELTANAALACSGMASIPFGIHVLLSRCPRLLNSYNLRPMYSCKIKNSIYLSTIDLNTMPYQKMSIRVMTSIYNSVNTYIITSKNTLNSIMSYHINEYSKGTCMCHSRNGVASVTGFVTRLTRQVPLAGQELLTLPEHPGF